MLHIGYGVLRYFQLYFSYMVVVSFIGEGNPSIWREPLTCSKSLPESLIDKRYHIMLYEYTSSCIPCACAEMLLHINRKLTTTIRR